MNLDVEMTSNENTKIQFISDKMNTLKVPDDNTNNICEYLRDGKLHFNETKLRAESHPAIAEKLLHFRGYRAELESTGGIVDIPPIYSDLIAALVQDSDEPFTVLLSRINDTLSPFLRNETMASKFDTVLEKVIKRVAHKVYYGLTEEIYANLENTTTKTTPWHLHLFRWEVHDIQQFPVDLQQAVLFRRSARQDMTNTISSYIQNISPEERSTIVNTKHRRSPMVYKEVEDNRNKQTVETEQEKEEKRRKKEEEKKKREEEKKQHDEEKRLRDEEKRQRDEEKKAIEEEKKKQREEEKRTREEDKRKREEEKKKKEQSQLRLTSLFAKSSITESTPPVEKLLEPEKPTLFPAFYIKDNVTIADNNRCTEDKKYSNYNQFRAALKTSNTNISKHTFLSELKKESSQKRGVSTHVDVRNLLLPGSADILHVPNVRLVLRMKLLQYHENVRPAYYGTFTKHSYKVSGRRPFAKDEDKLEYDNDSEAEWEGEGEGEDIVSGDEDDDDPASDMIDAEDAGWLVPEGYLSDNEGVDEEDDHDRTINKSARTSSGSKRLAVRKIVLGPYFEDNQGDNEVLKPFDTQFFINVSNEGYNPFYKEPISKVNTSNPTISTSTANATSNRNEFTSEHRNALITVINEKSGDSIPNLITEAKSNSILKDVSKRQLEANIKNIAIKEKRGADTKPTWYIKEQPSI